MLNRYLILSALASLSLQSAAFAAAGHGLPANFWQQQPLTVRVNGLTMQLRTALVDSPVESLADAILAAWRDAGSAGLRFDPDGGRTVLGRQRGPIHETVTLIPAADPRSTSVLHAANDSRQTPASVPTPPFALPRGLKIVQTVEQLSNGKPLLIFQIESELRSMETVERLRAAILGARWMLTSRVDGIERSAVLTATRAKQELLAVVSDRRGSTHVTLEITGHAP